LATVTQQTDIATWTDQNLDYLASEWKAVLQIASEWDELDEADRLDFVLEWPLVNDALRQLKQWNAERRFSASQHRQFKELYEFMHHQ
jgi:hypothetical protein